MSKVSYKHINFWIIKDNAVVLCGYAPNLELAQKQARSYVKAAQAVAKESGKQVLKKDFHLRFKKEEQCCI